MPTIDVPGHGPVDFPDSMSEADITAALRKISPPPEQHGPIAEALHKTASYLPMAGGIAGGALGATAGAPTGPGAFLLGALGAGALGGAGKGLQHLIDTGLGYEQPMSIQDAALDTSKAAGGEALGAGVGGLAAEGLSALAKPLAGPLREAAVGTARRILRNTGGSLSAAKPLSSEAAQEVLDMGIIKPFGTSKGAATRLAAARSAVGDEYGKIVQALEARGITGPQADALAQQYAAEGASVGARSMNPAVPRAYETAADQLAGKPTVNGRLGLTQAEDLKRSLQDQATSAYKQMQPGELARAHEETASMMRQAVEDEIAKQAGAPAYTVFRGSAHPEPQPGQWWSSSPEVADRFATQTANGQPGTAANVTRADLRFRRPLVIDAHGASFHRVPFVTPEDAAEVAAGRMPESEAQTLWRADGLAEWARGRGYDGLVIKNVMDGGRQPTTTIANLGGSVLPAGSARETQAIAAQFEPVKQQAGRLIEADNVAQAGLARAQNRHAFSPYDVAAAAGEMAHSGNPVRGAGAALLMHVLRTRGPSTAATALNFAANRLEDPASNLLLGLGAGGGAAGGPSLLQLLEEVRKNRSVQP